MNPTNATGRSASGVGEPFTTGRVAAVLALLVFAAFPLVALGLQSFVIRDFGFFAYPLAYFQRECFWRGELPLWNPWNACGVPFLAQWNTMPLYPPALLYLLLPLTWGLNLFCLLHLWFGGLGAFCLARRWTGATPAAAFAGVAFAFNGMTQNLLMWPSHIATFAWMPWVVLAVERAWREGGRRVPLAAMIGALQMLAGGPETILFTWLLLAAFWLTDLARSVRAPSNTCERGLGVSGLSAPSHWRAALRFPLVAALVVLLTAAQLLPFLDLATHSQRETGYADTRWSMPARGLANVLVPMAFGHVSNLGIFVQHGQGWTSSYYPGVSVLLLALLAAFAGRKSASERADANPCDTGGSRAAVLAVASIGAVLLAMGEQSAVYRALRSVVPQLSLMTYPVKFLLVVTFALPLLAAFGLAQWFGSAGAQTASGNAPSSDDSARAARRIAMLTGGLLVLIVAVLVWAWRAPSPGEDSRLTCFNGLSRAAFLIGTAALLLAVARTGRPTLRRLTPWALVVLLWLDALTHQPSQNPTAPPWIYQPGLARARLALQPLPTPGESRVLVAPGAARRFRERVLANATDNFLVKRLGLFADCNLLDGIPKVDGFFSLYPREIEQVLSALYGSTNATFPRLLDFLGVSHVTSPTDDTAWEARATFAPWLTAGQRPVFADDAQAFRALFQPDFDGRQTVFLPVAETPFVTATNAANARIKAWRFDTREVAFETEADGAALVVLAQTWYPRWRAEVDGRPTRLLRANLAFQAVEVPAGTHRVRLVYQDRAFALGVLISAPAWLACAAGCVRRSRARFLR
jgi:hypothetical protein